MDTATTTIDADLPCDICSYNLKSLAADGTCPECGYPVTRTTLKWLELSDPVWLNGQSRALLFLTPLTLVLLGQYGSFSPRWLAVAPACVAFLLTAYAAHRLTAGEGVAKPYSESDAWRRCFVAVPILLAAITVGVEYSQNHDSRISGILMLFLMALMAVMYWLIGVHLYRLARRSGEKSLIQHAFLVRWLLPVHLLAYMAISYLVRDLYSETWAFNFYSVLRLAVTGVMVIFVLLLGRLHQTLKDAAQRSRHVSQ